MSSGARARQPRAEPPHRRHRLQRPTLPQRGTCAAHAAGNMRIGMLTSELHLQLVSIECSAKCSSGCRPEHPGCSTRYAGCSTMCMRVCMRMCMRVSCACTCTHAHTCTYMYMLYPGARQHNQRHHLRGHPCAHHRRASADVVRPVGRPALRHGHPPTYPPTRGCSPTCHRLRRLQPYVLSGGIHTPEAIKLVWSSHREILYDYGPVPADHAKTQS